MRKSAADWVVVAAAATAVVVVAVAFAQTKSSSVPTFWATASNIANGFYNGIQYRAFYGSHHKIKSGIVHFTHLKPFSLKMICTAGFRSDL